MSFIMITYWSVGEGYLAEVLALMSTEENASMLTTINCLHILQEEWGLVSCPYDWTGPRYPPGNQSC